MFWHVEQKKKSHIKNIDDDSKHILHPVCSAVDLLPYLSILCHVVVHGVVGPLTMGRQQYHHFPVVFGLIGQGWRAWTDRRTWKIYYFYS